jgi:hypothetical protein
VMREHNVSGATIEREMKKIRKGKDKWVKRPPLQQWGVPFSRKRDVPLTKEAKLVRADEVLHYISINKNFL